MKRTKIYLSSLIMLVIALIFTACGTNSSTALAKNLDTSVTDLVYTVSSLDWVETNSINQLSNNSSLNQTNSGLSNTNNTSTSNMNTNVNLSTNNSNTNNNTNTNNTDNTLVVTYSIDNLLGRINDIQEQINSLINKRSALMLYINEIYNGNVELSPADISAINAYMNILRDNTSFMNSNKGMVRNHLNRANNTQRTNNNRNLINAYIIRANEAIETRLYKLEASVEALSSIISLIENKITPQSTFYNNLISQNNTQQITID